MTLYQEILKQRELKARLYREFLSRGCEEMFYLSYWKDDYGAFEIIDSCINRRKTYEMDSPKSWEMARFCDLVDDWKGYSFEQILGIESETRTHRKGW